MKNENKLRISFRIMKKKCFFFGFGWRRLVSCGFFLSAMLKEQSELITLEMILIFKKYKKETHSLTFTY